MFGIFTDVVDTALDVAGDLLEGETPSRKSVAKLIDAGLTVAAVATIFSVTESVIESLLED